MSDGSDAGPAGGTVRTLVVDDSSVTRMMVGRLLEAQDWCRLVGEAADGIEALERVPELQPDLILMDVSMPRMNGLRATQVLRERGHVEPRIVIVSFDTITAEEAIERGLRADGVVNKLHLHGELLPLLATLFPQVQAGRGDRSSDQSRSATRGSTGPAG